MYLGQGSSILRIVKSLELTWDHVVVTFSCPEFERATILKFGDRVFAISSYACFLHYLILTWARERFFQLYTYHEKLILNWFNGTINRVHTYFLGIFALAILLCYASWCIPNWCSEMVTVLGTGSHALEILVCPRRKKLDTVLVRG